MVFKKIKQRSIRKAIEQELAHRDSSGMNSKVRTLGFLVDELIIQDFEQLYDLYRDFGIQPKDVKVFSFVESKKRLPSLRQNQVQRKDFDWKGRLHNQNAQEFLDTDFDVLVGLYNGKHEILDMMVAFSKGKFKVGFSASDKRLYDLVLAISPEQIPMVKQELKKYLQVLDKL